MDNPTDLRSALIGFLGSAILLLLYYLGSVVFATPNADSSLVSVALNLLRFSAYVIAGWLVVRYLNKTIWVAILVGLLVLLVDHIFMRTTYLMYIYWGTDYSLYKDFGLTITKILLSLVTAVPVAILLSGIGGLIGGWEKTRKS